jgi:hypothetical protein
MMSNEASKVTLANIIGDRDAARDALVEIRTLLEQCELVLKRGQSAVGSEFAFGTELVIDVLRTVLLEMFCSLRKSTRRLIELPGCTDQRSSILLDVNHLAAAFDVAGNDDAVLDALRSVQSKVATMLES